MTLTIFSQCVTNFWIRYLYICTYIQHGTTSAHIQTYGRQLMFIYLYICAHIQSDSSTGTWVHIHSYRVLSSTFKLNFHLPKIGMQPLCSSNSLTYAIYSLRLKTEVTCIVLYTTHYKQDTLQCTVSSTYIPWITWMIMHSMEAFQLFPLSTNMVMRIHFIHTSKRDQENEGGTHVLSSLSTTNFCYIRTSLCMYVCICWSLKPSTVLKWAWQFWSRSDAFETGSTVLKQTRLFSNLLKLSPTALKPTLTVLQLSMFKLLMGFSARLVLCNVYGCTTPQVSCSQSGQNGKATNAWLANFTSN